MTSKNFSMKNTYESENDWWQHGKLPGVTAGISALEVTVLQFGFQK
jgi:hypothetical protein